MRGQYGPLAKPLQSRRMTDLLRSRGVIDRLGRARQEHECHGPGCQSVDGNLWLHLLVYERTQINEGTLCLAQS